MKMEMSVDDAFRRSIRTLFEWIHKEVDKSKTHVVFRTYAPVHFRFVQIKFSFFPKDFLIVFIYYEVIIFLVRKDFKKFV